MKKLILNIFCIISVLSLILLPCDFAWTWSTHSQIVEKIYESLPTSIQKNLDLNEMKDGSNDPDEKFHDFSNHNYPNSYYKANEWLKKGKIAYNNKNYYFASYCYGVASHYISDTYSAPHSANDKSYLHSIYENQANKLKSSISYFNNDLYTSMKQGDAQGEKDWSNWKKTRKSSIVQNDLNRATSATYLAIKNSISN